MKVKLKSEVVNLHLARKNKSKSWLALRLGISSGYLSQLMSGSRHPSPKVREQFLRVLPDLGFDDLFTLNSQRSNWGEPMKTDQLSKERRWLVEQVQQLRFGIIKNLEVCRGQPVIDPGPEIISDVKFGARSTPSPTVSTHEWALKLQFIELFDEFDARQKFTIEQLEIHDGLPFRRRVRELPM